MLLNRIFIAVFLLTLSTLGAAQNTSLNGRFPGRHFSVDDFNSAGQIWTGMQGTDDLVYFGNNDAILCFNGVDWKHIETSEQADQRTRYLVKDTKVQSMVVSSDGTMCVARRNNFGYIAYDSKGAQRYFPILAKPDDDKDPIGYIWSILDLGNGETWFVGEHAIYSVKNKKATRVTVPKGFEGYTCKTSARFGNGYLIPFSKIGAPLNRKYLYLEMAGGKLSEITLPGHINIGNIRGSFEIGGRWYLLELSSGKFYSATVKGSALLWNAPEENIFPEISEQRPNHIYRRGDFLYMGTETQGLIVADLTGKVYRRFDLLDEMASLYVNRGFHDREDNMWLCLDNGIQVFETSSPITQFRKNEGVTSLAEAIDFGTGQLLAALHSDVFTLSQNNGHRTLVSKEVFKQEIYDLRTIRTSQGRKTLAIAYNGIFEYDPVANKSSIISKDYGLRFAYDKRDPDKIFFSIDQGGGVGKMELQPDGKWKVTNIVPPEKVKGNLFSIAVRNGIVYFPMDGEGIGIYNDRTGTLRIFSDKKLKKGDKEKYYVERFGEDIFVSCENLLYRFENDSRLVPFEGNELAFEGKKNCVIHRIVNLNEKQLWIVMYKKSSEERLQVTTGWLEKQNGSWSWTNWPLDGLRDAGIVASIQQGPRNEVWLGASNGVFVLNFDAIRRVKNETKMVIDRFEVNGGVLRYNVNRAAAIGDLVYAQNSFRVFFHANTFRGLGNIAYRYKLEGFDDEWSEWSSLNYATFQKIGEGNYTLKLQAKNAYGIDSEVLEYRISILPPWYRSIWAYLLYFVAFVVLIVMAIRISTFRVKRQNQKLEEIVRERTSEIAEQNHQLEHQKAEIEAKTTDILDSIQYAKRIQTTILPSEVRLNELFEEHFVFYRPKDIVSGDFYWAREVQGKTIFAAVDCTGHGVPGSLVSIVGNNGLLRAVNEFRLTDPNEILDKLREIVVDAFRSESQLDVKDGMDIALCSIDYATDTLRFSGANNECVIIRKGEIFELKPDKQPIGSFIDAKKFTGKEFQLEDGDCIYLYTDGYVDQFGGEKGKKFKSRQFKSMLMGLNHLHMRDQLKEVQQAFDSWMSDFDQIDDVCVFAVRFKKRS
jgi:serine phosphatase RsbU (regulator of sigma subunit)